jgi:transcriptional regulator with PAS, ATPase and Fis domain
VENIRDVARLMHEQADIETTRALFSKYYTSESLPELKENISSIVAESRVMREALEQCRLAARTGSTILLSGPTGSGKSLLARFVHESSPLRQGPFITINCSAIPDQLFESELFGYARGAFSGASAKGRKGIVELAQNGTLFLDEVNSIPVHLQPKLLHFLQEKTYAPVGSNRLRRSTCRILAAANQDLRELIRRREFRSDLYYRLSVLEIAVPGLEKRRDDIAGLVRGFLQKCNAKLQGACTLHPDALAYLQNRDWPGNARELENCIERLTTLSPVPLLDLETVRRLLPQPLEGDSALSPPKAGDAPGGIGSAEEKSLDEALADLEKRLVEQAWRRGRSSYKVAEILGTSQNRAYRLIKKYRADANRTQDGRK